MYNIKFKKKFFVKQLNCIIVETFGIILKNQSIITSQYKQTLYKYYRLLFSIVVN